MKRLFIAINLPKETKQEIARVTGQIKAEKILANSNFRWVPADYWHLTVSFLGWQPEEAIPAISKAIWKTAEKFPADNVKFEFEKVIWGPYGRPARMIWLAGSQETSRTLGLIRDELEKQLVENKVRFQKENRPPNPHLTLARFSPNPKHLDVRLPKIERMSFSVKSLDLMESRLKRTGAEYEFLKKVDFI